MTPLEAVLRCDGIRTVFQPIVDLETSTVVAHEALTRGPGGALAGPLTLFAEARRERLLTELDEACRTTAVRSALDQQRTPTTIFLNAEPEAFTAAPAAAAWEALAELVAAATPHLHVVLEITERDIPTRPATLLRTIERVRALGWGIALDDVGVSTASLAFMPLLAPDVVKLDAALVQRRPSSATAQIVHAVNDYAERSGALVLAEGIETPRQLAAAQALGAHLGQGWFLGHPDEQLVRAPRPSRDDHTHAHDEDEEGHGGDHLHELLDRRGAARRSRSAATRGSVKESAHASTPFATLSSDVALRTASKALLMQLSTQLEEQAARSGQTCILTSAFQHARHFTAATARRYEQVAEHAGFVYAVGEAFADVDVSGVHAASLPAEDPLCSEWDVAVIGPHFHAALLARDLGSTGPDLERVFEYVVTYRYDTVVAAVRDLLLRVAEQ